MPDTGLNISPEPLIPEKAIEREFNLPSDHLRYCRRKDDPPPFIKRRSRYYYYRSSFKAWLHKDGAA